MKNIVTLSPQPIPISGSIEDPSGDIIKSTPSLWNASLEDAFRYGGDLTRTALGAMNLRGDRRYVTVDTKIHMLMPGFIPGIPGWHTDGAPRNIYGDPGAKGAPDMIQQLEREERAPRYHLLVTGDHCPTRFLADPFAFELPLSPSTDLYAHMTQAIKKATVGTFSVQPSTVYEMGWWDAHEAVPATAHGWRFLIRVTESDWIQPQGDLRQIIRLHNPVYISGEFGW